jgi:NAD+ synthase (glutamine-hydrolysing)
VPARAQPSGYGCEDAFLSQGTLDRSLDLLRACLPATRGLVVSLGLPLSHGGALYNTACLAVDGAIAGFVAKRTLAGGGVRIGISLGVSI